MSNPFANNAVKVAVRERPSRENFTNVQPSVITYHPNGNNIIVNESIFTFDHVLGPAVSQSDVFNILIMPLIANLKEGFNCTALAYGQTGTGKSYTMGLNSKSFDADDVGVIPRCLKKIFSTFDNSENQENTDNEISISFIEIYNEKVFDLFAENPSEPIAARGYKYTGGVRKSLSNIDECYEILMQGNKNRHVRPTKMNAQSSRSHAIFTIHVRCRTTKVNGEGSIITSCMNIVDLAGSEGVRRTGHQGVAMSEGVNINQGLLSIGKVLQAITTGSKLIPYRDSVLSSVLQDSLNSNSYLTLLACVSPHREDLSETLSTLRFAQNAKQLKHAPQINNILTDIKKNAKLKQTPYKAKPIKMNNTRATPLKRTCTALYDTQMKTSVKSNTFCTPKKQRIEVNKCNQTEICNYKGPKLSNNAINFPRMNQWESTHSAESMFNKSLDSNGSLQSLNISTSTTVDGHAIKTTGTHFSPVIRKCMVELENNIFRMLQNNMHKLILQTPTPSATLQNQTMMPSTLREELKNIMKEILSEKTKPHNDEESNQNLETANKHSKCQLFNMSDELFKIPEIPLEKYKAKTSSPTNEVLDLQRTSESFANTFFTGVTNSDNTVLKQSKRRSYRTAQKQSEISTSSCDASALTLRRSSRKSVLEMYQHKRRSVRLATLNKSLNIQRKDDNIPPANKLNKTAKLNSITSEKTDVNSNGSKSTTTKMTLTKHRKAILDLLNKGSMKEIQILPQIGQKTAYQIVTQRTLNGKFKSLAQVEKLPFWRGTAWNRFAQANMLI